MSVVFLDNFERHVVVDAHSWSSGAIDSLNGGFYVDGPKKGELRESGRDG